MVNFRVKTFLAQHFQSDFFYVSIKKLPLKRLFKYPCEEVLRVENVAVSGNPL